MSSKEFFDKRLMCFIEELNYSFLYKQGYISIPEMNACDMQACIKLFENIDKGVLSIYVVCGNYIDLKYFRNHSNDKWQAFELEKQVI